MITNKHTVVSFQLNRDDDMKTLNKQVFDHDFTTDVISFPMATPLPNNQDYLGEIVVNQDQVKRNAEEFGVSYAQELARVVAHGVLHLLGYEDDTPEKKAKMTAIEDAVVREVK
ncbi:rRNA maturation RNase YbeY [candidate division WWE3 bacterium]|nr:rRNA maturation RNase YbeY [candidate division WWE3 bacterium]